MSDSNQFLVDLDFDHLTDEQRHQLREQLGNDPQFRQAIVDHLCLEAALAQTLQSSDLAEVVDLLGGEFEHNRTRPVAASHLLQTGAHRDDELRSVANEVQSQRTRTNNRVQLILATAILMALTLNVVIVWKQPSTRPLDSANSVSQHGQPANVDESGEAGVAILARTVGVRWPEHSVDVQGDSGQGTPDEVLTEGSVLTARRMRVDSGVLQIEFFNGTSIVVEGPAEFEIRSSELIACNYGRMRAYVPSKANELRIIHAINLTDAHRSAKKQNSTESFSLVSSRSAGQGLGNEFGLEITADGDAQVHVFNGQLLVKSANQDSKTNGHRELVTGYGVRIANRSGFEDIVSDASRFPAAEDLAVRQAAQNLFRFMNWVDFSKQLKYDNRVLVYYDFENAVQGQRVLPDRSQFAVTDASVIGCDWTTGRWPQKRALDFKRKSDRLTLRRLEEEFSQLTFCAWVRIDALPRRQSSIFMTDRYEHGNPHWQLTHDGRIELGVGHKDKSVRINNKFVSPAIVEPGEFGSWVFLVTVYDAARQSVMHYANGRAVSKHRLTSNQLLRFSDAEIGNWLVPRTEGGQPVRNFNGRMDEFILFKAALTSDEVEQMYERTKP